MIDLVVHDADDLIREKLSAYVDLDAYAVSIDKLTASLLKRGEVIAPTR